MDDLELNTVEMRHILAACAPLRLRHCTPEYLQDFIAARLDGPDPDLAVRVRQLPSAQMHELCLWILREQGAND
jgi:hypothetical protein